MTWRSSFGLHYLISFMFPSFFSDVCLFLPRNQVTYLRPPSAPSRHLATRGRRFFSDGTLGLL